MAKDIKLSELDGRNQLSDGDIVKLETTPNACPADVIEIGLRLDGGVTWWKGIELSNLVVVEGSDFSLTRIGQVSVDVFNSRSLHLWKGKVFNVHSDMYQVVDAHDGMTGGNRYVFAWLKD